MEWLDQMNAAVGYLEGCLDGKVDYVQVARIACCSLTRFQRMFALAAGMSPSEYVRLRRMALAAAELLRSDEKIVDLALKYGYFSPEAFTRSFRAAQGMPPTEVRRRGTFADFPRFVFRLTAAGGALHMGKGPIVRIEEHGGERVASFAVDCSGPESAAGERMRAWAVKNLTDYAARRCVGCAPKGHHPQGVAHRPGEDPGFHEYVMQMFLYGREGEGADFRGAEVRNAPEGLFLVGDAALDEYGPDGALDLGSSMQTAYGIMDECLKNMGGYAFDLKRRRHLEEQIFTRAWWSGGDIGDEGLAGFRLWLPIIKV